jgi:hypothetical protein
VKNGDTAHTIYAGISTTSVASDPKNDVFVRRAMAFEAGGFAGGGELEGETGSALLVFSVVRKGIDSAIFGI